MDEITSQLISLDEIDLNNFTQVAADDVVVSADMFIQLFRPEVDMFVVSLSDFNVSDDQEVDPETGETFYPMTFEYFITHVPNTTTKQQAEQMYPVVEQELTTLLRHALDAFKEYVERQAEEIGDVS